MVLFLQLQKIFRQLLCGGVRIQVVASCPKLCCPIESGHVPRRMLSDIANGDLQRLLGIAFQNQPHMPEHGFHAFFQRRRHYQFAGHCRLNLPKQKRIPIGAPSCHDQVTVKFRLGWDENSINAVPFAQAMEAAGAAAITVHGRTKSQLYSGKADWNAIREVKQAVSIPVIGNGDVQTAADCLALYEQTGCDLVMAGRGTYGNPFPCVLPA